MSVGRVGILLQSDCVRWVEKMGYLVALRRVADQPCCLQKGPGCPDKYEEYSILALTRHERKAYSKREWVNQDMRRINLARSRNQEERESRI